jgi:CelD/BcsL family acetyltransferase involved in cellulose biosynthesis
MLSRTDSLNTNRESGFCRLGSVDVAVHNDIADLRAFWTELETSGTSTVFQSLFWCETWVNSPLRTDSVTPVFVTGRNVDGVPVFLLPLQKRTQLGFVILEFLTAPLASYGHLVCGAWCNTEDGYEWFEQHFDQILELAGNFDVVCFRDMPADLNGLRHPFSAHFNMLGPDTSLTTSLARDVETFIAERRSSDSRKNMRWRDSKLAQAGKLEFSSSLKAEELMKAAEELFYDQGKRLSEAGIADPFGTRERVFFKTLLSSQNPVKPTFRILRLSLDGLGISSIFAAFHGNTCSNIMTSLAQTSLRRYSPGDLVLRKLIGLGCELNFAHLDLGIGDHDYKKQWANTYVALHHTIRGRTFKGVIFAALLFIEQSMRRVFKTNRMLREAFFEVRRRLFGKTG